jgi:hypothetical protein
MVDLFVSPNAAVGVPKVWAYENVPGNCNIYFGSIHKNWAMQVKPIGYAISKEQEKCNDGYMRVGSFSSIDAAVKFRDAYKQTANGSSTGYQYDKNDPDQRNFAVALSRMGFNTRAIAHAAPQTQSQPQPVQPAPAPAAPAPRPAPSQPAPSLASLEIDGDDSVCLL